MKRVVSLLVRGLFVTGIAVTANAKTNYVAGGATGAGTGVDWANAYTTLSQALAGAAGGDSVWVAQGTYYPGASRTDSHRLVTNVAVYGGFTTQMVAFSERNWTNFPAILDGDLDLDGTPANNAYHVVAGAPGAALDGFVIRNGNADGTSPNDKGGGLFHTNGVLAVRNCTVTVNRTGGLGAGLYAGTNVNIQLQQCVFSGNIATNTTTAIAMAGAIYMDVCTGTLVACSFLGNGAAYRGGAVYLNGNSKPTFEGCTFTSNGVGTQANNGGGAFYTFGTGGRPTLRNCTFILNAAPVTGNGGGGALYIRNDAVVEGCQIVSNKAPAGGGAYVYSAAKIALRGCTFVGNFANTGGGLYVNGSAGLSNCTFTTCLGDNYGGAIFAASASVTADDCRFSGNLGKGTASTLTLGGSGAAVLKTSSQGVFRNCLFTGNQGYIQSGCLSVEVYSSAFLTNCLFAGNWVNRNMTSGNGGALYVTTTSAVTAVNCTFGNNRSTLYGGAVFCDAATFTAVNCILWTNVSGLGREAYVTNNGLVTIRYTNVKGGWNGSGVVNNGGSVSDGGGNRDVDPLYTATLTGTWTATGVFDFVTGQTLLVNTNAGWTPGALVGRYVNPDPADADTLYKGQQQYCVATNSATTLTVWGDASWGASGETYRVYDYHLQSRAGRWTPLGRVQDAAHSPCIDAGDPATPVTLEPMPNRGIVNMGSFGNTLQASLSAGNGTLVLLR